MFWGIFLPCFASHHGNQEQLCPLAPTAFSMSCEAINILGYENPSWFLQLPKLLHFKDKKDGERKVCLYRVTILQAEYF